MSIKQRTTTINGNQYGLFPMPPLRALTFVPKLATTLAEAAGKVAGGVDAIFGATGTMKGDDGEITTGSVLSCMQDNSQLIESCLTAVSALQPEKITELSKEAMYGVSCDDGKLDNEEIFEHWFTKHPADMFRVCVWAIFQHQQGFTVGSTGNSPKEETGKAVSKSQKDGK